MSGTNSALLSFVLPMLSALHSTTPPHLSSNKNGCYFDAIYSFGDSMADTGNLLIEGPSPNFFKIGKFPYGKDAFKRPTGRCSNGYLMIDYFAMALGLPLIPPYLDKKAKFDHGVNFAVAGATALDKPFLVSVGIDLPFTNSSLSVQLDWFDDHLKSLCGDNTTACDEKMSKSLFFLGEIGGNDYNYAALLHKPVAEMMSFLPLIATKITNALKILISKGAKHIIVPGNYPIGCFPCYLTMSPIDDPLAYDNHHCIKALNAFSTSQNLVLADAVARVAIEYPNVNIMYADYFGAFKSILDNMDSFEFDSSLAQKACCGGGTGDYNFNKSTLCGFPKSNTCGEPSKRISWDGVHLTQEAYRRMVSALTLGGHTNPHNNLWKEWICHKEVLEN